MSKVLIIEDDGWLADSYASTLRRRGFEVDLATSAEEAMKQIDDELPDVVVADIMLGTHNALTLLHELQSYADTVGLPIIVCTGLSLGGRERRSLKRYGVVDVLDKARLRPAELADSVETQLRRH